MNIFESVLLKYGAKVVIDVRDLAEFLEMYEDCAKINSALTKYGIKTTFDLGDWQNEFWKKGASGDIAFLNLPYYYHDALVYLYGQEFIDNIVDKFKHIKINTI